MKAKADKKTDSSDFYDHESYKILTYLKNPIPLHNPDFDDTYELEPMELDDTIDEDDDDEWETIEVYDADKEGLVRKFDRAYFCLNSLTLFIFLMPLF